MSMSLIFVYVPTLVSTLMLSTGRVNGARRDITPFAKSRDDLEAES